MTETTDVAIRKAFAAKLVIDIPEIKPHHITEIEYPVMWLLERSDEHELKPIHNSINRYQPKPLIDDKNVAHNASRDNIPETRFFSITETTTEVSRVECLLPSLASTSYRLVEDMQFVESCCGDTTFHVATYRLPCEGSGAERTSMVRIRRQSVFAYAGDRRRSVATYNIKLETLEALDCKSLWLQNLMGLIYRRSDRAVLHVARKLREQRMQDLDTRWKPGRYPDYALALKTVDNLTELSTPIEPDTDCAICWQALSSGGKVVELACKGKHVFHLDCFLQVYHGEGPGKIRYPLCREALDNLDFIRYGVTDNIYQSDSCFNRWEDFERSCADLDKSTSLSSTHKIMCKPGLFWEILRHLIEEAKKEPSSSTPYHLQAVSRPELKIFREALEKSFRWCQGQEMTATSFYDRLNKEVLASFNRARIRGGTDRTLSEGMFDFKEQYPYFAGQEAMPPGFYYLARRIIRRMLEVYRLRACKCGGGTFHWHGRRAYFNADCELWLQAGLTVT